MQDASQSFPSLGLINGLKEKFKTQLLYDLLSLPLRTWLHFFRSFEFLPHENSSSETSNYHEHALQYSV